MTKFGKYNQDVVLTAVALCMILGVGAFAWWGTNNMVAGVNKALNNAPSKSDNVEIDIDGAKKILGARGLVQ